MRLRWFLAGVLVGLALAPTSGHATWQRVRNTLAAAIDTLLAPRE